MISDWDLRKKIAMLVKFLFSFPMMVFKMMKPLVLYFLLSDYLLELMYSEKV